MVRLLPQVPSHPMEQVFSQTSLCSPAIQLWLLNFHFNTIYYTKGHILAIGINRRHEEIRGCYFSKIIEISEYLYESENKVVGFH
jgi:hypothetical protein